MKKYKFQSPLPFPRSPLQVFKEGPSLCIYLYVAIIKLIKHVGEKSRSHIVSQRKIRD